LDLYLAIVGFFVIAILWALIIFGVLRVGYKIKKKSLIFILFFFIGICAILVLFGVVIEYTESPEFCGTACHPRANLIVHDEPMRPYYDSYINPDNNSIMKTHADEDVTCSNCHDAPGVVGKLQAYTSAIAELFSYITGSYDSDHLEAHVTDDYCLKCHNNDEAEKPGEILGIDGQITNPHDDGKECVDCHDPHQDGIGLTIETCIGCHDLEEAEIHDHGITSGQDCWDCHNRVHPDKANIPFSQMPELITSDFCGDCHGTQYNEFSDNWTVTQKTDHIDCSSACHMEHKESTVLHDTTSPYEDNCQECHTENVESHKFFSISYTSFKEEIENNFCEVCHETEYDIYTENNIGECVDCHIDHTSTPTPSHLTNSPYDECFNCHVEYNSKHNISKVLFKEFPPYNITNEFCNDCHSTEFDTWKSATHSSQACVNCHYEHNTILVKFEECEICHVNIPLSHDESRTKCITCHDIDKIHSIS
jgi:predicted CXXCH cytochrome family protein